MAEVWKESIVLAEVVESIVENSVDKLSKRNVQKCR